MGSFAEDKADLGPTGKNPFIILEPGYQLVLEDAAKKEKLTITVLDETRTVDGVVTRVAEEREVGETTPLEPSSKKCKLYAPGVGLLTDGSLRLTRYGHKK
jgi:hypothetical protein